MRRISNIKYQKEEDGKVEVEEEEVEEEEEERYQTNIDGVQNMEIRINMRIQQHVLDVGIA